MFYTTHALTLYYLFFALFSLFFHFSTKMQCGLFYLAVELGWGLDVLVAHAKKTTPVQYRYLNYPIFLIFGHLGAKTPSAHTLSGSWHQGVRILLKFGSTSTCTSATKKVSARMRFYTKNSHFHPLIPPPTTELKIR